MAKFASGKYAKQFLIDQEWNFHIKKWLKNGMVPWSMFLIRA